MVLHDTQHWWTKSSQSKHGNGSSEGLIHSKTFWESSWLWHFMRHHYSRDRAPIVLRNHMVSLRTLLVAAVAIYEADFQNIVLFWFISLLLLFICMSLCFVSHILFKIQKWCEALGKFSEVYNFNFCIFLHVFSFQCGYLAL